MKVRMSTKLKQSTGPKRSAIIGGMVKFMVAEFGAVMVNDREKRLGLKSTIGREEENTRWCIWRRVDVGEAWER